MAGTVIDALVVELNLDASKFSQEQSDAILKLRDFETESKRSGGVIEEQGKRIVDVFQSFRRETLIGLGVFFGGKEALDTLNYISSLDANTGRLAKTMDISGKELSSWQGAIEMVGGSTESANAALAGLSGEVNKFALTGQSSILPVLSQLHIGLYDQNHQLKTASQLWMEIGDAIQGLDPARATALLSMIPGINQGMINFLLLSRQQREEYLRLGAEMAPTPADIMRAQQFQVEMVKTERAAINLGRTFLEVLGPSINWVLNGLSGVLQGLHDAFNLLTGKDAHWFNWGQMLEGTLTGHVTPSVGGATGAASGGATRGDRNNNPGNIKYGPWAVAHGATGSDGTFAIFSTPAAGEAALEALLASKSYSGLSLSQLEQKWVGNPNATYLGGLEAATGLGAGDVPNLSDPAVRAAVARGISQGEGTHLSGGGGQAVSVKVGDVYVNAPNAKDSPGAMQEVGPALQRSIQAAAANTGQL